MIVYMDTAVITERRRTPRRAVSWAAPLSQVAATVRVMGMAPLAAEGAVPVAVAVTVRAYVSPIVVLKAVLPTVRAPVAVFRLKVLAAVPKKNRN